MNITRPQTGAGRRSGWLSGGRKRLAARANVLLASVSAMAVACSLVGAAQAAPKLAVLYSFKNIRGEHPYSGLISDAAGNLYGTANGGGANGDGAVIELSPPAAGKKHWTETVLFSFNGANGYYPYGNLIADGAGNLYGTASVGGNDTDGVVFELSPPKVGKKQWIETVLKSFGPHTKPEGVLPNPNLISDGAGNLYGTTVYGGANNDGVVFELSPPSKNNYPWTETVLQSLGGSSGSNPLAGVVADGAGNLYGTTFEGGPKNDGVVFELSPPALGQTAWTETVLQSFSGTNGNGPAADLLVDSAGNLYGTTRSGGANSEGVAFEMSPPAGGQTTWTEMVLTSFNAGANDVSINEGLIADAAGNLYGTLQGGTSGYGLVYELSPPKEGKTAWTDKVLHTFDGADGSGPQGSLMLDGAGNLYGTTVVGGAENAGAAFELAPRE